MALALSEARDYELGELIGGGSEGQVRRGRCRSTGRPVAVKRLFGRHGHAFYQELGILTRLRHPHIVELIDFYEEGTSRCLVYELCEGGSLQQAMFGARLTGVLLPRIGRQLSGALAAIHAAGVLHGDVKPANILLADRDPWGSWKLADFGVAHDGSRPKSRLGFTPRYAAPERLDGHFGPASDVFALGMTLLDAANGLNVPTEFREMVLRMVRDEIEARPTAEEAYHAFVQIEARSVVQRFVADDPTADLSLF